MDAAIDNLPTDDADMPPEIKAELEAVSESRRDFMKVTGMAAMGAVIAGCTAETTYVKPAIRPTEGVRPGVSYDYASTCRMCGANCGTLVKVRDGRPIKAEGNPQHPLNQGALCMAGQAQMWNLYNPDRLHGPRMAEEPEDWAEMTPLQQWRALDAAATAAIGRGDVRLLTGTVNGPAAREVIRRFVEATGARHVAYDAVSAWPIAKAHGETHGVAALPRYRFDRADVIVSFDADFLGAWISPTEFSRQWASRRDLKFGKQTMSRHIQFEGRYSLTGGSADERFIVPDSRRGALLADLANRLAEGAPFGEPGDHGVAAADVQRIADELRAAGGRALVVSGSRDVRHQKLVNWINQRLGAYGRTLDLNTPSQQKLGNDDAAAELLADMEAGRVKTLIVWGANPVYDLPQGERFAEALDKVGTKIAIGCHADETASLCDFIAAEDDALEQWDDFEPQKGLLTLAQPLIRRLWDTRPGLQTLLNWAGDAAGRRDYRLFLREFWEAGVLRDGESWKRAVEMGFVDHRGDHAGPQPDFRDPAEGLRGVGAVEGGDGLEVFIYQSYTIGDGRNANNGWLQEVPDPLTRVSWTNFAAMAPATIAKLGLSVGDIVELSVGGAACRLPVVRQPGQAPDTVAVSLGYGRTKAGRIVHGMGEERDALDRETKAIGGRAYHMLDGGKALFGEVKKVGSYRRLALFQTHDTQEGRPLARSTAFELWRKDPKSGNKLEKDIPPVDFTLWPRWEFKGHKWGMVVDLNLCTGCNACVVACNVENNIPIVGKDEIWRRRDMHWIRIDTYYDDDAPGKGKLTNVEDPEVIFQPMMCQHCDNAPCETVCPVIATSQSDEGLNTMTYNRCIGTRYCANNCPYKVRRFNWFTYKRADMTMNLALNPDITVRTQGVMEKCSMCAQRIYEGKRVASLHKRKPEDGEIRTACQATCPTEAIIFGDVNNKESRVAKLAEDPRHYAALAEINVRPAVHYLVKVRNRKATTDEILADQYGIPPYKREPVSREGGE